MRHFFGGKRMRKTIEPQMLIGEISIADIQIDLKWVQPVSSKTQKKINQ